MPTVVRRQASRARLRSHIFVFKLAPVDNERHYSLSRFGLLPFCVKQSNLRTSVTELSLGAAGF